MNDRNEHIVAQEKFCESLLIHTIQNAVKQYGFSRKGRNFTRRLGRIEQRIALSKSRWGNQYYIDLWMLLSDLDSTKGKRLHDIATRVTYLAGEDSRGPLEREVLNCEHALPSAEREAQLTKYVESFACPFIEEASTFEGLRVLTRFHPVKVGFSREALALLNPELLEEILSQQQPPVIE